MLVRSRLSRIYYRRKFFDYPLKMNMATLGNLGPTYTAAVGMSYMKSRVFQRKPEVTLEDFFINRFGDRLYRTGDLVRRGPDGPPVEPAHRAPGRSAGERRRFTGSATGTGLSKTLRTTGRRPPRKGRRCPAARRVPFLPLQPGAHRRPARTEPQRHPYAVDQDRRASGEQAATHGEPARRTPDSVVDLAHQVAVQRIVMTAGDAAQHVDELKVTVFA